MSQPILETISCPRGAVLDSWSNAEWSEGIQLDQLEELTMLAVRTSNTLYEIRVLDGPRGEVLVRGGQSFPVRTAVRLEGSTFGGSILKVGGLYPGMRIETVPEPVELVTRVDYDPRTGEKELLAGHKVIRTSPIQSIGVVADTVSIGSSE